jgi:hypothetical protein
LPPVPCPPRGRSRLFHVSASFCSFSFGHASSVRTAVSGLHSNHAKEIQVSKREEKRGKTGENGEKRGKTGENGETSLGGPRLSALGNCPQGPARAPFLPRRARRGVGWEFRQRKMSIPFCSQTTKHTRTQNQDILRIAFGHLLVGHWRNNTIHPET